MNRPLGDDLEQHGPDPLGVIGWVIGGKYKVRSYIGGGGFGEVYEGFNSNLPQQRLVLKFFKEVSFRERFDREAQILCRLDHPNISRVMDYYPDENALVMQYIDGQNTDQLLRDKGPLESSLLLKVAREVAGATAYAHKQGVAHRDLKPGNILVDKNGHVYLIDFGIAKETTDASRTRTGYAALSVNFAAPERQGGRLDYNPYISDVYELGITLFNLATNSFPYRNPAAPVFDEWKDSAGKTLAPGLRNVLKKATHPDPKRRYQSVEVMASELNEVESAYLGSGYSKVGIAAAAVVVLAVAGFFAYPVLFGGKKVAAELPAQGGRSQVEPETKVEERPSIAQEVPSKQMGASDDTLHPAGTATTAPSTSSKASRRDTTASTTPAAPILPVIEKGLLSVTVNQPSDIYVDNQLRRSQATTFQESVPVGAHAIRIQRGDDPRQWLNESLTVTKGRTTSKSFVVPVLETGGSLTTGNPPITKAQEAVVSGSEVKSQAEPVAAPTTVALIDKNPPAEKATPNIDNTAVIKRTIGRFQQALENADLNILKTVWPTMSDKEQDAYKGSFASGGMVLSGNISSIQVTGAEATALFSGTAKPNAKGARSAPVKFEFTFMRTGSDWLIKHITTMK